MNAENQAKFKEKEPKIGDFGLNVAEMQGFEPWRRRSRPTGFRIRTLQPLGYISVLT